MNSGFDSSIYQLSHGDIREQLLPVTLTLNVTESSLIQGCPWRHECVNLGPETILSMASGHFLVQLNEPNAITAPMTTSSVAALVLRLSHYPQMDRRRLPNAR